MTTSNKRKHAHRRSSSLAQPEENSNQGEKITLVSDISSNETM